MILSLVTLQRCIFMFLFYHICEDYLGEGSFIFGLEKESKRVKQLLAVDNIFRFSAKPNTCWDIVKIR